MTPTETTIEERLIRVEDTVRDLQRIVGARLPGPNWLNGFVGSMDDYPEFDEIVRLGREFRETDRPAEDELE